MTAQEQEYRTIPLNHGRVTIVDLYDYEKLSLLQWRHMKQKMPTGYAILRGRSKRDRLMHNIIMLPPKGFEVDRINGDGLDNRRFNLRLATRSQQCMNRHRETKRKGTSRYRGVRYWKRKNKWGARITLDGKTYHLGWFPLERLAALAYNEAARRMFGNFAKLNEVQ